MKTEQEIRDRIENLKNKRIKHISLRDESNSKFEYDVHSLVVINLASGEHFLEWVLDELE